MNMEFETFYFKTSLMSPEEIIGTNKMKSINLHANDALKIIFKGNDLFEFYASLSKEITNLEITNLEITNFEVSFS